MEPITTVAYILSSFYGYYISSDIWNYYTYRRDYIQLTNQLDSIQYTLNRMDSKLD